MAFNGLGLHLGNLSPRRSLGDDRKTQSQRLPMLTGIVQSTQEPERVITSLVWLGTPNELFGILGHALYFSSRTLLGVPIERVGIENRKSRVSRNRLASVGSHQRVSEIVESSAVTLQYFAKDDGESTRNFDRTGHIVRDISRLWVAVGLDYAWAGFVELSQLGIKVKEVIFGPIIGL